LVSLGVAAASLVRTPTPKENTMKSYFLFDLMLTPKIVIALHLIGFVLIVLGGLGAMFQGELMGVLIGFGTLLFGPVVLRLSCETVMVIFKLHENLHRISSRESR